MNKDVKAQLSKLKFFFGLNPVVEHIDDKTRYIPTHKKAVILISADFELAWAPRYDKSVANALAFAKEKAANERKNIPLILKVCDQFNIPVTWATVGHLFLEKCTRIHEKVHSEIPSVPKYSGKYWDFNSDDWFEYDPCTDYVKDPLWYSPDLIEMILNSKVKHELGNHTFSHVDCRDNVCPPELLRTELIASQNAAAKYGIKLQSFVHPGHTIGNLDILAEQNYTNFRTDYGNVLGYPERHSNGLWELKQTCEFVLRKEWSIEYHIKRYKKIIDRALQNNSVCVFWFHPSFETAIIEKIWPSVFKYIDQRREDIWVATHGEYIEWLENNVKSQK